MAAQQGYAGDFEVSADDSTYNTVSGANSHSMALQRTMLDITDFDNTAMNRIAGLFDVPVSFSGHYDPSDTGQSALRTAFMAGSDIYARSLVDGTNGFKVTCLVESFELSSAPDGTTQFSASLQSKSAPSVVS